MAERSGKDSDRKLTDSLKGVASPLNVQRPTKDPGPTNDYPSKQAPRDPLGLLPSRGKSKE